MSEPVNIEILARKIDSDDFYDTEGVAKPMAKAMLEEIRQLRKANEKMKWGLQYIHDHVRTSWIYDMTERALGYKE